MEYKLNKVKEGEYEFFKDGIVIAKFANLKELLAIMKTEHLKLVPA